MKLSKTRHKSKPKGKEIGLLSKELEQKENVSLSAQELADSISKGHTVVLGNFYGERKVSSFTSTKYLGLDIDSGATLEETLELCNDLQLNPSVYYHSFSADVTQEKHNHRVFIELDREVNLREYKLLQLGLMKLFPACDVACKDAVRIWFPTDKGASSVEGVNEVSHLLFLIKKYFYELDSSVKTQQVRAFAQLTGIEVINGQLALGTELNDVRWSISLDEAKTLTKSTRTAVTYKKSALSNTKIAREMKGYHIDDLRALFPLVDDFFTGELWLTYPELLMIASNLQFIKGGLKAFHEVIDMYPQFYDNREHSQAYYHVQVDAFINYYEVPKPMSWTGRFEEYDHLGKNLLTSYEMITQNEVVRVEKQEEDVMTLEEANGKLNEMIEQALNSSTRLSVLSCPAGLGKTEQLVNGIDYNQLQGRIVLAFPTHKLSQEVHDRFFVSNKFKPAITKPAPYHILPAKEQKDIRALHRAGDSKGAGKLFKQLVKQHKLTNNEEYKAYKKSIAESKKSKLILTTHHLASSDYINELAPDYLIFDEDSLLQMFKQKEILIDDIYKLLREVKEYPNNTYFVKWLTSLLSQIEEAQGYQKDALSVQSGASFSGQVEVMKEVRFSTASILTGIKDELREGLISFNSPVLSLFDADYYTLAMKPSSKSKSGFAVSDTITVVSKPELPAGVKKILVLSATADKSIWGKVDTNMDFYQLDKSVEAMGEIVQILDDSTFKSKMDDELANKIAADMKSKGVQGVITNKDSQFFDEFDKPHHFGSVEGQDGSKGKILSVVGTPNLPESQYNLLCYALSGELPTSMKYRVAVKHGIRFKMFTYESGFFQDFHFYFITSQLEQSASRVRELRTGGVCYIYSQVPVKAHKHYFQGKLL